MFLIAAKSRKYKWQLTSFLLAFSISLSAHSTVNEVEYFYFGNNVIANEKAPLVAAGPISAIDFKNNYIVVHGQQFVLDAVSQVSTTSQNYESSRPSSLADLAIDDYVAITGDVVAPGIALATDIILLSENYVEGASFAFIAGFASDIDKQRGLARIGNTVVDYTGALFASSLEQLDSSSIVEFKGTSYGNSFFATSGTIDGSQSISAKVESSVSRAGRGSGIRAEDDSALSRAGRGSGIRRAGRGSGIRAEDDSALSRAGRGSGIRRAGRGSGIRAEDDSALSRAGRGSGIRRAGRGSGIRAEDDSALSRAGRGSGIRRAGRGSGIRAEDDSALSRAGRGSGIRRAGRGSGIRAEDDSALSRAGRGSGIRRAGRGSGIRAEDDSALSRAGRGSGIRRAGRGSGIRAEDDSALSRAGRGSGIR